MTGSLALPATIGQRMLANHSIEGTNNGGSGLGFLSRPVPPSFAPHVKRLVFNVDPDYARTA